MNIQLSEKGAYKLPKEKTGQCMRDMTEECYTRNNTYEEDNLQPRENSLDVQSESSVVDAENDENASECISKKSQGQIIVPLGNPGVPKTPEYRSRRDTIDYEEDQKRDSVSRRCLTPVTRSSYSETRDLGKEADAKKLRSLTLGRMGKMLKIRKSSKEKDGCDPKQEMSERDSSDLYKDQDSMKGKANSLGRMLKLIDKDGAPRKLFSDHRAGSLSGIFYKRNTGVTVSPSEPQGHSTGIFAKVLNQLRGRVRGQGPHGAPEDASNQDENKGLPKEDSPSRKSALASRIMGNLTLSRSKKSCSVRANNPEHPGSDVA